MAARRPWWRAAALAAVRTVRRRLRRFQVARRRQTAAAYPDERAYRRARNLLRRCLSPGQRHDFDRRRAFTVQGASGRLYRIGHGSSVNVEALGAAGEVEYRLCAGPAGLPIPAVMLAQKLMLESQEAEFLRIAVKHPPWRGAAPEADELSPPRASSSRPSTSLWC